MFFHTNGYGDCVLLDELGWPWPVHHCWERHRWEQAQRARSFEDVLYAEGFDGRFRVTEGRLEVPPDGKHGFLVSVSGFVSDNHVFYENPVSVNLTLGGPSDGVRWVRLDVFHGGIIYPFLVPQGKAKDIDDYSVVRAVGRWVERAGDWHLILARLTTYDIKAHPRTRRIAWLGRRVLCRYCGQMVQEETPWGFDRWARVECGVCFELRDGRSPRDFLALCRRIAGNNQASGQRRAVIRESQNTPASESGLDLGDLDLIDLADLDSQGLG